MTEKYDVVVIGAGMSGLAAGIRLAMFDKKVVILEKHTIAGGLNSYYQRKNTQTGGVRKFDVGLHALTNFIEKGEKRKPFSKLLKQLRFKYDDFKLKPQNYSSIIFPEHTLKFSNDFELLRNEVHEIFPTHIDEFNKLVLEIENFNEVALDNPEYTSAKKVIESFISNTDLCEMLLAPLLIYGSAWENDMDFSQFVIMFKSIYLEGFSRPEGGVRTIIDLLLNKFESVGGELRFRSPVENIGLNGKKVESVTLKSGEVILTDKILSSMGLPETIKCIDTADIPDTFDSPRVGQMSFMESIIVFDKKVDLTKFDATIAFWNNRKKYKYQKPTGLYDKDSAVFCVPDNYDLADRSGEGTIRITHMANYAMWKELERANYKEKKQEVFEEALKLTHNLIPGFDGKVLFHDVFSPTTVEKYTWHHNGTVYGSIDKTRDGRTQFENLFIIGTDQGFLGIVGSMLSGISMANLYGLME
jgi:phytoene dehydrogenase-like protein